MKSPICLGVICACLLALPSLARAQNEALTGPEQFPEFRNLSGLSGSGYGVDWQGNPSLAGPVALSTPVAYVLGHNRLRLLGGSMGNSADPATAFRSSSGNSTVFGTYGGTIGPVNIALTDMVINTSKFSQVFNLQLQYVPRTRWAIMPSIGVQDIRGGGGSAGEGIQPADRRTSTSYFITFTHQFATGANPLFVSAGVGSRRFKKGFASASYQVVRPVRAFLEWDGLGNWNEGVLFSWMTAARRPLELNAGVAFVRGEYITLFAGIGY